MTAPVEIRAAGDSALVVELGAEIDSTLNAQVVAIAATLSQEQIDGVRDVISSYASVTVCFDPLRTDLESLISTITRHVTNTASTTATVMAPSRSLREIPVCYGGVYGPDLEAVANYAGCSTDDVVRLHSEVAYRVYLLGFVPGFAYMAKVNERIAMPRRETPRVSVLAGTVGIADCQTGIYPSTTPGGWQLIGRSAFYPFDPNREEPFLFTAGDTVRFVPVDEIEFRSLVGPGVTNGDS
ncbi:MAG: 5-oxoprolinase subunit PxpB [Acidobacteriota bacterium]|nr:5-oxoprolinase subunit PxpB [Acidobacteriota bacterium]